MIIDMNMVSMTIADLNKELHYKISEKKPLAGEAENYDFLVMVTNGEHVTIKFMGIEIWNSQTMKCYENPTIEEQIDFGERDVFEPHIRRLIQDELDVLERVVMV